MLDYLEIDNISNIIGSLYYHFSTMIKLITLQQINFMFFMLEKINISITLSVFYFGKGSFKQGNEF